MNPVNMVAYRGNEVNLGGDMCVQQAESMHPFGEQLQEEVQPAAGGAGDAEEGHWGAQALRGLGESGGWCMAPRMWVCSALLCLCIFMWEITRVNSKLAVLLMWDMLIWE